MLRCLAGCGSDKMRTKKDPKKRFWRPPEFSQSLRTHKARGQGHSLGPRLSLGQFSEVQTISLASRVLGSRLGLEAPRKECAPLGCAAFHQEHLPVETRLFYKRTPSPEAGFCQLQLGHCVVVGGGRKKGLGREGGCISFRDQFCFLLLYVRLRVYDALVNSFAQMSCHFSEIISRLSWSFI